MILPYAFASRRETKHTIDQHTTQQVYSASLAMHLEQLLSSTTSESIDESLHMMVAVETNAGAVETTRGTSGSHRERWTGRKLSTEAFTREEIDTVAVLLCVAS